MTTVAITSFFNPAGYASRKRNYDVFSRHLAAQNIDLFTVEVAFEQKQFELSGDNVIQLRTNSILWHKEDALNVAIKRLPREVDIVAFVDCDVVFLNPNWLLDASRAIENGWTLVQPFEKIARLPRTLTEGNEVKQTRGFAAGFNELGKRDYDGTLQLFYGDTGFGWVASRELLQKHLLYSGGVLGGGDLSLCHAAIGTEYKYFQSCFFNERQRSHYREWSEAFYDVVRQKVTYVSGAVAHLWHGSLLDRGYNDRHNRLLRNRFCPYSDIKMSPNGLLEWATDKPELHGEAVEYFFSRNEDE